MGVRPEACEAYLAAGMRGETGELRRAVSALEGEGSALAHAWALVGRSALAELGVGTCPPPAACNALAGQGRAIEALAERACGMGERLALADFDARRFARYRAARPGRSGLDAEASSLREQALRGEMDEAQARSVGREAAQRGRADLVVELSALRALVGLLNDPHAALRDARRTSRAARTEGILSVEYLANIVLARARRASGSTFAASRILSSLVRVCAAPWRGWLTWELALVGRLEPASGRPSGGASTAAHWLRAAADTLLDGRRPDPSSAPVHLPAWAARDLSEWMSAVDIAATGSPQSQAFRDGTAGAPPGAAGWLDPEAPNIPGGAWVLCTPDGSKRVLGLALAGCPWPRVEVPERAALSLAALALAGPDGIPAAPLYELVFDATYDAVRSDGLLRTTLYRARAAVDRHAELTRENGRVVLSPRHPFAVPDPRSAPSLASRALRILAQRGESDAREVGDALGVALRTAQKALKELVDDGLCDAVRRGRHVAYVLEDTTFSNPTLHRLSPRDE